MRSLLLTTLLLSACRKEPPTPHPLPSPTPVAVVLPSPSDPRARLAPIAPSTVKERLPDPLLEWAVEARPAAGQQLRRAALLANLDENWRRNHDTVRLYGWKGESVVVISDDDSERYDRAAVAIRLLAASGDDDLRMVGAIHLKELAEQVTPRLRAAGAVEVVTPQSPDQGGARALKLREIFRASGCEVQLHRIAPNGQPFDGRALLDVLLSLGISPDSSGDLHFADWAIKTGTAPGRFDPARLLDGRMRPASLMFVFYVPDVAHPLDAFDAMVRAATYTQRRLGGNLEVELVNFGAAQKSDFKLARARVSVVAAQLDQAGFPAGAPSTKRLFAMP